MPLHDWTRVRSGLFHHFRQDWLIEIARDLNRGRLPNGLSALVEQRSGPREPDVLAIESFGADAQNGGKAGAVAVAEEPQVQTVRRSSRNIYADRANRIVVRHHLGRIVAVIEIVSPGNKDSRAALREFVEKTIDLLRAGVHVLIIDLFPPAPRDPSGIHKAIWDEIEEEDFDLPDDRNRTFASYESGNETVARLETRGVGDELPAMPLYLASGLHIPVPLETTYKSAWDATPVELRRAVEAGKLPTE